MLEEETLLVRYACLKSNQKYFYLYLIGNSFFFFNKYLSTTILELCNNRHICKNILIVFHMIQCLLDYLRYKVNHNVYAIICFCTYNTNW